MNEMNLKEYFFKMQNGDKEAFVCIYQELNQPVYTIAYRIVQSKEMAEDITHDVFVKLFTSPLDSLIINPRAWIFQMTRNLALNALKEKQCTDIEDLQIATNDIYNHILMRRDMETALSKLPRVEREIISLHLNGELHFHEISKIVGLSIPATYRKYRKALATLRKYLTGGAL